MGNNLINSAGRPRVFAYLNTGVTNVTGSGSIYQVLLDTVLFGTGYNTGAGIYTAPFTGNYLIASSIELNNLVSGANGNQSDIFINNTTSYRTWESGLSLSKSNNNIFTNLACMIYNLTAGQTVAMRAIVQNSATNIVGVGGGNNPYVTWLYVCYLS